MEIDLGMLDLLAIIVLAAKPHITICRQEKEYFKKVKETRFSKEYLLLEVNQTNTYEKIAFVRILENIRCHQDDLDKFKITREGTAAALEFLRESLKDVIVPTPEVAKVTKVNEFFKHTLRAIGKGNVEDLL